LIHFYKRDLSLMILIKIILIRKRGACGLNNWGTQKMPFLEKFWKCEWCLFSKNVMYAVCQKIPDTKILPLHLLYTFMNEYDAVNLEVKVTCSTTFYHLPPQRRCVPLPLSTQSLSCVFRHRLSSSRQTLAMWWGGHVANYPLVTVWHGMLVVAGQTCPP